MDGMCGNYVWNLVFSDGVAVCSFILFHYLSSRVATRFTPGYDNHMYYKMGWR